MEKIRDGGLESLPASSRRRPLSSEIDGLGDDLPRLQIQLGNARKSLWQRDLQSAKSSVSTLLAGIDSSKAPPSLELRTVEASARSLLGQILAEENGPEVARETLGRAIEVFRLVLDRKADSPQTYADYGAALHWLGMRADASRVLHRAFELGDTSPYSARLLAGYLLDDDKAEEAKELLQPVYTAAPGDIEILSLLGQAEHQLGHRDMAVYYFREAAAAALHNDDLWRAVELCEHAASLSPDDPDLYAMIGALRLRLGQPPEPALAAFDRALTLSPGHSAATLGKADALRMRGDLPQALALLDSVAESTPAHTTAQAMRGEVLRLLGRHEEALAALNAVLRVETDEAWVIGTRGQVLRALDLQSEARADLEGAVKRDPRLAWAWAELAATCYELDDTTGAVLAAHEALALDPDIPLALAVLARCDIDTGDHSAEAAGRLRRLVGLWPELDWARAHLAEVLLASGDQEAAHRIADEMIDQGSAQPGMRLLHAELLLAQDEFDVTVANSDLDAYLASEPEDVEGLRRAGSGYRQLGDHQRAVEVFGRVLRLQDDLEARRAKAASEFQLQRFGDVLATLKGLPPSLLEAQDLWRCGESACRHNELPLANRFFKQALEADSDHVPALVGLAKVNRRLGKLDRARKYAGAARAIAPDDRAALIGAAQIETAALDYTKALGLLTRAHQLHADDPDVVLLLGNALIDTGQFHAAVEILASAYEIRPQVDATRELLGFALENLALDEWRPGLRSLTAGMREVLSRAREIYEGDDDLYLVRGRADIAFALEGADAAQPIYQEVVAKLATQREADIDLVAMLGWCYFRLGRHDEAIRTYVGALSARTGSAETMYLDFDLALAICCSHGDIGRTDYERAWVLSEQVPMPRRRGLLLVARNDVLQTLLTGVGDMALLEGIAARFDEILSQLG